LYFLAAISGALKKGNSSYRFGLFSCIIIALFIGLRPFNIGTDTGTYMHIYNRIKWMSFDDWKSTFEYGNDPIFNGILIASSVFKNYQTTLLIVSFLTNIFFFKACAKIASEYRASETMLYLILLSCFTVWNEQVNTMRSGMGVAFFLNFCYHLYKEEKKPTIIYGALAMFSHFSTLIFIGIALIVKFLPKIKMNWYVVAFFVTLVLSYMGYSVLNMGIRNIEFDKVDIYTSNIEDSFYKTGFRPAFALYNTFFLMVFLALRKKLGENGANISSWFLKLYIGFSCLFFLWFAIPYSDRIGAFGWQLIPIMLIGMIGLRYKNSGFINFCTFLAFVAINYFI
jgi:hypothetical protein